MSPDETLSPREIEIASAYAQGDTYQAISARLGIAPSTVRTHLATIYRKLGVSTKLDLRKQMEASTPIDPSSDLPPRQDKPSIAVLAFANMSDDPGQEYFSDAITADIITALSRFPGSSSSLATPPSPTKAKTSMSGASRPSSACASCWRTASGARASGCASPRS